jgi:Sap, sulfolipid-1-addressing protein
LIIELLALGLASTVRPTSLAAVSAFLSHASRRRLLLAYIVGGLAFTIAFGVVVVGAFHGIHIGAGSDRTKGIAAVVGGALILLVGCAVLAGLVPRRSDRAAPGAGAWKARLDRRLTVPAAAVAGPLTHLPGLFYLIALNIIVAHQPRVPGGLVAIMIYNAVWFTLPIAALAACIINPDAARDAVLLVQRWTGEHSRALLLYTSFIVGGLLVVRGALVMAGVAAG